MQADVSTNLPGQQRMLLCGVVANQQHSRRVVNVAHASRCARFSSQGRGKSWKVGRAMVINVIGTQHQPREFLQQIVFFVAGAVGTDDTNGSRPAIGQCHLELRGDELERLLPRRGYKLAFALDERQLNTVFVVGEVERITSLNAKEVAVDTTLVAVVAAHNLHACVRATNAERSLATVATMCANRADMLHLPGTSLITVSPGSESADRANVDAHAAFFALQMILFIGSDDRTGAAVLNTQRPNIHTFAADADAAVTQDASWTVEVDHRRPLLLVAVVLQLNELRFRGAVLESHVLQFALATRIAHRAVERMIAEQ